MKVGRWGGFVFINPNENAEPLEKFLGDLSRQFPNLPYQRRSQGSERVGASDELKNMLREPLRRVADTVRNRGTATRGREIRTSSPSADAVRPRAFGRLISAVG